MNLKEEKYVKDWGSIEDDYIDSIESIEDDYINGVKSWTKVDLIRHRLKIPSD